MAWRKLVFGGTRVPPAFGSPSSNFLVTALCLSTMMTGNSQVTHTIQGTSSAITHDNKLLNRMNQTVENPEFQ